MVCVENVAWNEMRESMDEKETVSSLEVIRSIRDAFIETTVQAEFNINL